MKSRMYFNPTMADKAAFYAELRWTAQQHAYSTGWAAHKYREKFGVWPNDPRVKSAAPTPPSLKTKNWVRSHQIALAKARDHG